MRAVAPTYLQMLTLQYTAEQMLKDEAGQPCSFPVTTCAVAALFSSSADCKTHGTSTLRMQTVAYTQQSLNQNGYGAATHQA